MKRNILPAARKANETVARRSPDQAPVWLSRGALLTAANAAQRLDPSRKTAQVPGIEGVERDESTKRKK